jgi:putative membrane protein
MLRRLLRFRGTILVAVVAIGALWFAASGRLLYFVNPAYLVFTIVMCAIAIVFCVARVVLTVRGERVRGAHASLHDPEDAHDDDDHDHDHDEEVETPPARGIRRVGTVVTAVVGVAIVAGIVLLPPATLSSATAVQRAVGTGAVTGGASLSSAQSASTAAFAHFTVRDWASLLGQTSSASFYDGKPVDVTGFVAPSPDGSADVFYLSRFIITCCAVDAQPVGVPVYLPGWREQLKQDQWLQLSGVFTANQATSSSAPIALVATKTTRIDAPGDPYLY